MTAPMRRLYLRTYGCQMNVYDSERMAETLAPLGYRPADAPEDADMVLVNTCHIREKASEKTLLRARPPAPPQAGPRSRRKTHDPRRHRLRRPG